MKNFLVAIICIGLCFLVAFLSSQLQYDALTNWYPHLVKSPLNPPAYVFPVAWSILYILMGVSVALVISNQRVSAKLKRAPILLFIFQLLLNYTWSFTFFYSQAILLGAVNIVLLIVVCLFYMHYSKKVSRVSSYLFIPYILWLLFALYLNSYIYIHN